jgi:hypothetical protein
VGVVTEEDDIELPGEHDEVRKKLEGWSKDLDRHWGEWVKEASVCQRFAAGHQYTTDEENEIKDGRKIPVTFNRIGPVIDAVVGSEIQGRQQTQYQPRELGDAMVNEVLTEGAEWLRDQSDADGEESDAKRDAFITGLGAVSTELEYEEDPQGKLIYRRLVVGSALPDPRARQSNAADARFIRYRDKLSRDEFKELYGDVEGVFDPVDGSLASHNADPRAAYNQDGDDSDTNEDLVTVDLWQWYEVDTVVMAQSQDGQSVVEYTREQFEALEQAAAENGYKLESVTRRRRRYMSALMTGRTFLEEPKPLEFNKFTIQFITGKRDPDKGVWYGLVRPMIDPQKWANAFFSMLLHMVRTNAKGGIMAEEGAIGDKRKFEQSLASSDEITIVEDGALSGNKVIPKPQPNYPAGIDRLMEKSIEAIRDVTGVNAEMLGLTDRDQPGVLEAQRKQSAYGLLATFFESFRRYRKLNGELLLEFMKMLGPETLVRVTGEDGIQKFYVQLQQVLQKDAKYDVIVDEMPAGPNQKERTWAMITQIVPAIKDQMSPEMWAEFIKYSPFPESLSIKLRELIMNAEQSQQEQIIAALTERVQGMEGQMQQLGFQAEMADKAADTRMKDAKTKQTEVETLTAIVRPDPNPQVVM